MPDRHLPVRPDLEQLRHQAKDFLRDIRAGRADAVAEFSRHHPRGIPPASAKLADAQLALARSYGVASWPRLVQACELTDAIWRDDADAVRQLVTAHPKLLVEDARGVPGNWGPPMSYAANLGRDQIIELLRSLGATDVQFAFDRAVLQGQIPTARRLYAAGARAAASALMGAAETQNGEGMALALELGAPIADADGDTMAPVAMILETYCRNPSGKHRCLELLSTHGVALPDTAPMAVHRGRIDLLARHVANDPTVLSRAWSHVEIYPPSLGCHADASLALHGTELANTTLLHLAVDNDEWDIVRWLLEQGMRADASGPLDEDGFGGHTALFGCVVSQPYRVGRGGDGMARLLLDAGADPNARASLRKRLRFVEDETMHEYRDVTPLGWGERFHDQDWVNPDVMRLLAERGGRV
ncbi:MAG: ankyrin repeat domain-containing protein [Gemmatimonadaceae bacterium]